MVLGEILQLDVTAGPAASAGSTVELEHAAGTVIGANGRLHGLIFADGGFGELCTELQDFADGLRCGFLEILDGVLI